MDDVGSSRKRRRSKCYEVGSERWPISKRCVNYWSVGVHVCMELEKYGFVDGLIAEVLRFYGPRDMRLFMFHLWDRGGVTDYTVQHGLRVHQTQEDAYVEFIIMQLDDGEKEMENALQKCLDTQLKQRFEDMKNEPCTTSSNTHASECIYCSSDRMFLCDIYRFLKRLNLEVLAQMAGDLSRPHLLEINSFLFDFDSQSSHFPPTYLL